MMALRGKERRNSEHAQVSDLGAWLLERAIPRGGGTGRSGTGKSREQATCLRLLEGLECRREDGAGGGLDMRMACDLLSAFMHEAEVVREPAGVSRPGTEARALHGERSDQRKEENRGVWHTEPRGVRALGRARCCGRGAWEMRGVPGVS